MPTPSNYFSVYKMIKKARFFIKNYLQQRKAYQFFMRDWVALSDLTHASDVLKTMRFSQNLQPTMRQGPDAQRLLVIAPHPDDETIGPGGTLLKALKKGAEVMVMYLTCGTSETSTALKQEALQVASSTGYHTTFLKYFSKNIPINDESLSEFSKNINQFKPDIVFLPFLLDDHDDHRRASHLLLNAYQKKLLGHSFEIWAYQVYTPLPSNVIVDITDIIQEKENLIQQWKIQNQTRNWAHFTLGLNAFNQRFLPNGPEAKYAEGFFVLPLQEYMTYCHQYFKNSSDCYYHDFYKNE